MKQLSQEILSSLAGKGVGLPADDVWQLPEKVLQFGTGVLLRGLPDYYINEANNKGNFNGRVVVVKSTDKGDSNEFAAQDHLYTHCIKGIVDGKSTEQYLINASISRVIHANTQWQDILACAANPQLQIIISNTTEVGIVLHEDDNIHASPPHSFPGKLLAFLYKRYEAYKGSDDSGLVIIPTELIIDNGKKLKEIVHRLAQLNHFEDSFIYWLLHANDWCSSLVDRIVPGALPGEDKHQLENLFGYTDNLAIMSEPYNLWAIETNNKQIEEILSFSGEQKGIIITDKIEKYRELKLRLLNATHTFGCGLAFLSHLDTVNAAMKEKLFYEFMHRLLYHETIPCLLADGIPEVEANAFAEAVLDRFANPFIQHQWLSISLQYTSKMKTRCVSLIVKYDDLFSDLPTCMTLGFAAYLLFNKATIKEGDCYYGERDNSRYRIQDDEAGRFYLLWQNDDPQTWLPQLLADTTLWNEDVNSIPTFTDTVITHLQQLSSGMGLQQILSSASQIE